MIRGIYKKIMLGIMIVLGTSSVGALNEVLTYEADIIAHIQTGNKLTSGIKVNVNSVILDHHTIDVHHYLDPSGGSSRDVVIRNAIILTSGNIVDGKEVPIEKGKKITFKLQGDELKKGYLMIDGTSYNDGSLQIKNKLTIKIHGTAESLSNVDSTAQEVGLVTYGVGSALSGVFADADADGVAPLERYSKGEEIGIDIESMIMMGSLNEIVDKITSETDYTNTSTLSIKMAVE